MRAARSVAVALLLAVAFFACSKKSSTPELQGSIYAAQIPIYPGVKLVDTGGGNYYEEIGGAPTFESKTWFFESKDSVPMMTAFYENRLGSASRLADDDVEEGTIVFKFTPKGAEKGEDVSVHIEPGKLHISEVVKPGKRKS